MGAHGNTLHSLCKHMILCHSLQWSFNFNSNYSKIGYEDDVSPPPPPVPFLFTVSVTIVYHVFFFHYLVACKQEL